MLQLQTFTFNPVQENTYIIINEQKQCWIVDPGMYDNSETKVVSDFIEHNGLVPTGIINTHTHLDHIFGVQSLVDKYHIPFSFHEKDLPVLKGAAASAAMFGLSLSATPVPTHFITENTDIDLGGDSIEVRFTPGHSPGSVVFYHAAGGWLIGGDVLFNGGIGRTDLPGGDFDTLINSIRTQVFTLPDNTKVFSGHGPVTTVGQEKAFNPWLKD